MKHLLSFHGRYFTHKFIYKLILSVSLTTLSFFSLSAESLPEELSLNNNKSYQLDTYLFYIRDTDIKDLKSLINEDKKGAVRWKTIPERGYSFGYVENPIWLKLNLVNNNSIENYYISFMWPLTDFLEMHIPSRDSFMKTGIREPLENRVILDTQFYFPLKISKNEKLTIYFMVDTKYNFFSTSDIVPTDKVNYEIIINNLPLLIFLVVSAIIILQNFIYFYLNRNLIHIYFFLYILFFSIFLIGIYGYSHILLIDNYEITKILIHSSCEFAAYFNILFIILLFDIDKDMPRIAKIYRNGGLIIFTGIIFYFFGLERYTKNINSILIGTLIFSYYFIAAVYFRKNKKVSVLFMIFWSFSLGGTLVYNLINLGFLPLTAQNMYLSFTGNILELIGITYLLPTRGRLNALRVLQDNLVSSQKIPSYELPRNFDADLIKKKLYLLLEDEKLHLEWDVEMSQFADSLNIPLHQFSYFLNKHLNTSFRDLINLFRIKHAQKLLLENPDETILSILYRSGFQSKATFNRVFLETIGTTPKNYRYKVLQDSLTASK